jgi:hypothetical protein
MGDVYAHTGVITQNSTSGSDWKYVKTNWGQNTPATRLVRISTNLYKLTISPNIRAYYGVPANEKILQMAFVFRSDLPVNNGGYFEGKTAAGGDIYVDVYESGLQIKLNKPSGGHAILNPGDTLDVLLQAQDADSLLSRSIRSHRLPARVTRFRFPGRYPEPESSGSKGSPRMSPHRSPTLSTCLSALL